MLAESFPLGVLVVTIGAYSNFSIWRDFFGTIQCFAGES